jgi:membrane-bound lytic murein transglycosylase D
MTPRLLQKPATLFLVLLFCTACPRAQEGDSVFFPVPGILKDNIAFWKKVYAEIPITQGILHDREYPLVIYKTIEIPHQSDFALARYVESERRAMEQKLTDLATQPESTWTQEEKKILAVFREHAPDSALAGAPERVRLQQGQKERFKEGIERSTAYVDTIHAIFTRYGVPGDLAYLPHVESSFNTEAYSKVGAAGLWQFMRGTGRLFLKINYLVDERRDPVAATVAAARLLRQNYEQLQAWPLAITAYNHGVNGMKRAVDAAGSRDIADIIRKYASPSFQFASKNFYACFLAAREIAKDPQAYFSDLHCAPRYEYRAFTLPSFMRPAVVCRYLAIPQKTLMEYNPSLRPVVFFQQKQIPAGFTIRIPAESKIAEPAKILAAVPDSLKSETPERSQYYSVRRGDNLFGIASSLGVPVARLALENNITSGRRIYAGQVLRVPAGPGVQAETVTAPETSLALAEQQVVPAPIPPALPPEEPKAEKPAMNKTPKPQAGAAETAVADSLAEAVMARADTLPKFAKAGKPGLVPVFDVSVYSLEATLSPEGTTARIKVSVDETIGHYADWLGIPTSVIRQLNRLGARSEIRTGGPLLIPAQQDLLARFVKARLEYHMALEEDFYSRYKVADVKQRIIRRGETLWSICNDTDQIPLWLFAKHNKDADLGTLMPGMRVWMPVIEEKTERDIALETGQAIGVYPLFEEPKEKGASQQLKRVP